MKQSAEASADFHWILPELAVGAAPHERHLSSLAAEHGVRAVVDCRGEACDPVETLEELGITFLHLPAPDGAGLVQGSLDCGVAWVNARLSEGRPTLIHCQQGMGRSALLALCVMVSRGHEPLAAFTLARARRPVITLSRDQMESYRTWLAARAPSADWEVPSFAALSGISWGFPPAPMF